MHANWTGVGRAGIPDEMCRESRKRTVQSVFLLGVKLLRMCERQGQEQQAGAGHASFFLRLPPAPAPELVRVEVADRLRNVCDLREDCIFQLRRVRDERVERTDTSHGSVEILKQLISDAGS